MDHKTTIQLQQSTVLRLKKVQESLSETYDALINKLIDNYEKMKKEEVIKIE